MSNSVNQTNSVKQNSMDEMKHCKQRFAKLCEPFFWQTLWTVGKHCETTMLWESQLRKCPDLGDSGEIQLRKCPDLDMQFWRKLFSKNWSKMISKKISKMSINISLNKSARAWVKRRRCKICTYRLKLAKQTANNTNSHHCMHDCDRSSCSATPWPCTCHDLVTCHGILI